MDFKYKIIQWNCRGLKPNYNEILLLFSFILFNELWGFLGEIETDNLTVSNSEIITFDFTVSKNRIFVR